MAARTKKPQPNRRIFSRWTVCLMLESLIDVNIYVEVCSKDLYWIGRWIMDGWCLEEKSVSDISSWKMLHHSVEFKIKRAARHWYYQPSETFVLWGWRWTGVQAMLYIFSELLLYSSHYWIPFNQNYSSTKNKHLRTEVSPLWHQTWSHLIPIRGSLQVEPRAAQTLGSRAPPGGSRSSGGAWMSQALAPRSRAGQTCTRGCHSTHGRGTHYRRHPVLWGMWPILWPAPAIGGWGKCPCYGRLYAGGTPFYFWGGRGARRGIFGHYHH